MYRELQTRFDLLEEESIIRFLRVNLRGKSEHILSCVRDLPESVIVRLFESKQRFGQIAAIRIKSPEIRPRPIATKKKRMRIKKKGITWES